MLRKIRMKAGLSQETVARALYLSTSTYQSYELGRRVFTPEFFTKFKAMTASWAAHKAGKSKPLAFNDSVRPK